MALVDCAECKKSISDAAVACPHCGYPIKEIKAAEVLGQKKEVVAKSAKDKWFWIQTNSILLLNIIIISIGLAVLLGYSPKSIIDVVVILFDPVVSIPLIILLVRQQKDLRKSTPISSTILFVQVGMAVGFISEYLLGQTQFSRSSDIVIMHAVGVAVVTIFYSTVNELSRSLWGDSILQSTKNEVNTLGVKNEKAPEVSDYICRYELPQPYTKELNQKLIDSVIAGDVGQVKVFLGQGADPEAKNSKGFTARNYAHGHKITEIERLLRLT